ncbi:hypothetical protein B0H21DRAFT_763703 [Amylocystis lapponica]|nr:hypothetical protein B0H21DRAFT_763703 [Amylocystis lapponica]
MTEWLPGWKTNGYRTAQNRRPTNLDLYLKLDQEIIRLEGQHKVKIGFLHVPREFNTIADSLARRAAKIAPPAN